jgi:hypothetical protein
VDVRDACAQSQSMAERALEIRLSQLVTKEDEPPMTWDHVEDLLTGRTVDNRPIYVRPVGANFFRILNGRHRFVAALIRGDRTLVATLIEL